MRGMEGLDHVKKWFDSEVAKLTDRMDAGYSRDQFNLDLDLLRSQRDEKMRAIEDDECVDAAHEGDVNGGVKVAVHGSLVIEGIAQKPKRKRTKKVYPVMPGGGALYMQSAQNSSSQLQDTMSKPSVVTWWQAKGPAASWKPKKKQRVDHRVQRPGMGSRGSDKRTPRQLAFKLEVINHYLENQRLKGEGRLDDPCLATARHFGINKSQVSKWSSKRGLLEDKMNTPEGSEKKRVRGT